MCLLKLSNTGNTLKLLVLSYSLKIVCRWINISSTVISQKIVMGDTPPVPNQVLKLKLKWGVFFITLKETSIGNRGSKSTILKRKSLVVKEQRVDGSWQEKRGSTLDKSGCCFSCLRCTLMGFERNYQIRNLSKQINIQRRKYTSIATQSDIKLKMDPWFITGFTDGEGCFYLGVIKNKKMKAGFNVALFFCIN
jgi:hypothetical protein